MDRTLFSRKRQGLGYANEDLPIAPENKMELFRRQAKELFDDNYTDLRTKDGTFDCEVLDDNGKPTGIRYCWHYYIDTDKHPLPELEKAMETHRASDHYQKAIIGFTGKSPLFKRFEDARFFLDFYEPNVKYYNEKLADDNDCRLYLRTEKKLEWAHILSTKDGGEEEVFENFRKDLKKINNAFLLQRAIRGLEIAQKEVADNKQYFNNVAHKIEIAKDVLSHCNWAQDQAEKYHKFINEIATPKKLTPFDCVSTNELHPVICGCLHENGTIVGTDKLIIWAHNTTYDKRYEGKIVLPAKSKVEISAGSKYPNWKSVIPQIDNWNTVRVDFAKLYNIASKACTYQEELDDKENSLFVKLDKLDVLMNFQSDLFCKFCRASATMRCDTIYFSNDVTKGIVATNENGVVRLMPRFSNKLTYEDKLAIPVAFPEDYAIDSNADDNDRERRLRLAKARAKAMIMLQEQRNRETKATLNGLDGIDEETFDKIEKMHKCSSTIEKWINGNRDGRLSIVLPKSVEKKISNILGRRVNTHIIASNGIRHSYKNHGNKGRKLSDTDIPISLSDYMLIPYIMVAPDKIEIGSNDFGRESIRFLKKISNGQIIVVEKESLNDKNVFENVNMWGKLSDVVNAKNPNVHVRNVVISTSDVAKIIKDAETAIIKDKN